MVAAAVAGAPAVTSIAIATELAVGGTSSVITETGLVNPDGTNNVAFGGSPHPRVASPGNVPAAGTPHATVYCTTRTGRLTRH